MIGHVLEAHLDLVIVRRCRGRFTRILAPPPPPAAAAAPPPLGGASGLFVAGWRRDRLACFRRRLADSGFGRRFLFRGRYRPGFPRPGGRGVAT
ncbi:MAG: hypothetical protein ACREFD_03205, partial [Stellaceae bacterium]